MERVLKIFCTNFFLACPPLCIPHLCEHYTNEKKSHGVRNKAWLTETNQKIGLRTERIK